jgi:signal transduction histidine kinase
VPCWSAGFSTTPLQFNSYSIAGKQKIKLPSARYCSTIGSLYFGAMKKWLLLLSFIAVSHLYAQSPITDSTALQQQMVHLQNQSEKYLREAKLSEAKKDFSNALALTLLHQKAKDAALSIATQQKVAALEAKYDEEKQQLIIEQQKFELQRQRLLNYGIIIVAVLLFALAYLYHRRFLLQQINLLKDETLRHQELSAQAVIEAEEKERKRIAGDLHDSIGQILSAARMNLSGLSAQFQTNELQGELLLQRTLSLIDDGCKEVRNLSHDMMPNALLKAGLPSAIKELTDKIDDTQLKVNLYIEGLNDRLQTHVETVLYRIIQEIVGNTIKHAEANHIDISLIKDSDGLSCTIEDNGKGFNIASKEKSGGIGLNNIRSRINYLKGTVEWDAGMGKGTLVAIHVPL